MDIKETVRRMSEGERADLAVYLRCLEIANDSAYATEMDRRVSVMRAGERFDREAVERLHRTLQDETL